MARAEIVLNDKGIQELMKSSEVTEFLEKKATGIKERCELNLEMSTRQGKTRTNVRLETTNREDYYRNMNANYILKALGGGNDD